jgi:hypothetical protein
MSGTGTYRFNVFGNARATGNFVSNSDARFKQDIQPIGNAMEMISKLQGTTYTMDRENFPELNFNEGRQYGFIAQEIRKVMPEVVFEDEEGYLGVSYDAVVPLLVEGIKAQQSQLENQKGELEIQKVELEEANKVNEELNVQVEEQQTVLEQQDLAIQQLRIELETLRNEIQQGAPISTPVNSKDAPSGEEIQLFQNRPNPVLEDTEINFYLPNTVQQASLVLFDLEGKERMRFDNLDRGYSNVTLRAGELDAGTYVYRLIADEEVVGSKKLILAK